MAGLGSVTGALGADAFWGEIGISARQDGTDRVIYNQTTAALYDDADGTGASASIQIASLSAKAVLTASGCIAGTQPILVDPKVGIFAIATHTLPII